MLVAGLLDDCCDDLYGLEGPWALVTFFSMDASARPSGFLSVAALDVAGMLGLPIH